MIHNFFTCLCTLNHHQLLGTIVFHNDGKTVMTNGGHCAGSGRDIKSLAPPRSINHQLLSMSASYSPTCTHYCAWGVYLNVRLHVFATAADNCRPPLHTLQTVNTSPTRPAHRVHFLVSSDKGRHSNFLCLDYEFASMPILTHCPFKHRSTVFSTLVKCNSSVSWNKWTF